MVSFTSVPRHTGVSFIESATRRFQGKPDRCFYIVYQLHGRSKREKVGWRSEGITAEMAAQVRAERVRDARLGRLATKKAPTFEEAWGQFDAWQATARKWPGVARRLYTLYLKDHLAHKPLPKIAPLDLERIKADMGKRGLSPQTVRHALALFRAIWNKAVAWGLWTGDSPLKKVNLPNPANRRERFLSHDEAARLLAHLRPRSIDVHDMALLSLHTGLRFGEITSLRWEHVNLREGLLSIVDTKSGVNRTAFMTPEVRALLEGRAKGRQKDKPLVFLARNGEGVQGLPKAFMRSVSALGLNAGVEDRRQRVTFHTLRHTFASWLAIQGTPILAIKDLMGHRSLAMTERYAKLIPDSKRQAVTELSRLFGQSCAQGGRPATGEGSGEGNE